MTNWLRSDFNLSMNCGYLPGGLTPLYLWKRQVQVCHSLSPSGDAIFSLVACEDIQIFAFSTVPPGMFLQMCFTWESLANEFCFLLTTLRHKRLRLICAFNYVPLGPYNTGVNALVALSLVPKTVRAMKGPSPFASLSRGKMLSNVIWYSHEYVGDVDINNRWIYVPFPEWHNFSFLTFINLWWPCLNAALHKLFHLTASRQAAFWRGEIVLYSVYVTCPKLFSRYTDSVTLLCSQHWKHTNIFHFMGDLVCHWYHSTI